MSMIENFDSMMSAAADGNTDFLRSLVEAKTTGINAQSPTDGATVLMTAAQNGRLDACELLIQNGADVNAANKNGATALIYAAAKGHVDVCRMLLEKGANANAANLHGNTSLMAASHGKHKDIVQLFIENKANVNAANKQGNTALMVVAENPSLHILRLLVENGADVNATRDDGTTVLMAAIQKSFLDGTKLLLQHGCDPNKGFRSPLIHLLKKSTLFAVDLSLITLLVEHDADINAVDEDGHTPIMLAAKQDIRLGLVDLLMEYGADLKAASGIVQNVVIVEHDIADGAVVVFDDALLSAIPSKIVILRLTNKNGLTEMPCIRGLRPQIVLVELDPSCACITRFAPPVDDDDDENDLDDCGFLCDSRGVLRVDMSVLSNITSFGDNFLRGVCRLTSLDLIWSEGLVAIGDNFLMGAYALKNITLAPATPAGSIKTIGDNFLANCVRLQAFPIQFGSIIFENVQHIGSSFGLQCHRLESVDTLNWSNVSSIGAQFFSGCSTLSSLELRFCSHLLAIPDGFLEHCTSLESVDLTPMSNVASIGNNFLRGTESLRSVHLAFPQLCTIGDNFLNDSGVAEVTMSTEMRAHNQLQQVGNLFLSNCSKLVKIDLAFLNDVGCMDLHGFLCGCSTLSTVDLSWFPTTVSTVPDRFLASLKSLESIDLTPLAHVTTIGKDFLRGAQHLKTVHFPFRSSLTSVGSHFVAHCLALETISCSDDFTGLGKIGDNFCASCSSLRSVDVSFLLNTSLIGSYFFANCKLLSSLDATPLTQVSSIGRGFLSGCSSLEVIDVSFFKNLTVLSRDLFRDCESLHSVLNVDVGFANVVEIEADFLSGCRSLRSLEFGRIAGVRMIGHGFAASSGLCQLDISSCVRLGSIGRSFLSTCKSLTNVHFPAGVVRTFTVGTSFLADCTALTAVDLRFLACADCPLHEGHVTLSNCSSNVLKEIKVPTTPRVFLNDDLSDSVVAHKITQLQWTWKTHGLHTDNIKLAALWLCWGGMQYRRPSGDLNSIPAEVAHEICQFLGTLLEELPSDYLPESDNVGISHNSSNVPRELLDF